MFNKYYDILIKEITRYIKYLADDKKFKILEIIDINKIILEINNNKIKKINISPYYEDSRTNTIEWMIEPNYTYVGREEIIDKYSDIIIVDENFDNENPDYFYYRFGYRIINQEEVLKEINRLFTWNIT